MVHKKIRKWLQKKSVFFLYWLFFSVFWKFSCIFSVLGPSPTLMPVESCEDEDKQTAKCNICGDPVDLVSFSQHRDTCEKGKSSEEKEMQDDEMMKLAELFPDKREDELKDLLNSSGSVENAVAAIIDGPEILGNS